MLDKRLELGGLQVGGPRAAQVRARFRKADNVYQTPDGYMIPRADSSVSETLSALATEVRNVFRYNALPFSLGYSGNYKAIFGGAEVPGPNLPTDSGSLGVQAQEKLGNLYLNFPLSGLYKYDGVQCYRAGSPLPYYQIPNLYLTTPTFFTRVVQSHMDSNGNIVHSGYYEHKTALSAGKIQLRVDKGAADTNSSNRPTIEKASSANGYNAFFVCGTTFTNVDNTTVVDTAGDHFVEVGVRLIADSNAFQRILVGVGALPVNAVSYEILSFTGTTVTIGNMRYLNDDGDWIAWDYNYIPGPYYPGNPTNLCHYFQTVWTSDLSTGVYYLQKIIPSLYESNVNHTIDIPIASVTASPFGTPTALNLGPIMSETYDVLSSKMIFPLTTTYLPLSMTAYKDLCLIAYSNEIYLSDTSRGGSFEMTEGTAFILVGEGDDGNVQSICGNSDFLVVSRQYRNYYVSGNLPTANYRVADIEETSMGAYSNEAMCATLGKVFLFNRQGIWAISGGGACSEVSEYVRGLFDNFSGTTSFEEESVFNIDSYPVYASIKVSNQFVRVRVDEVRKLIAFAIRNSNGTGSLLVLNLNNGEFYTWSGFNYQQGVPNFKDITFINGEYFATRNGTGVAILEKESKGSYGYAPTYPPELATTWFTAGEPSLDKKLNQLKFFGRFHNVKATVTHCIDWKTASPVSDVVDQLNSDSSVYSHKIRLIPANFLAVSVSIKLTEFIVNSITQFQVEGMEIEYQPLQENMKR